MSLQQETLRFDRLSSWCTETGVSVKELLDEGLTLLSVSASACCGRTEVLKEEILAEGTVSFCALLRSASGEIQSVNRTERFSISQRTNEDMGDNAHLLLNAEAEKIRGYQEAGSLMLSCTVRLSGLMILPQTLNVPLLNGEDCFLKKQMVPLTHVPMIRNLRFSVNADTVLSPRLPEVRRVLTCKASVCVKEAHLSAGQLILGGDLLTQTIYEAEDEYEPVVEVTDRTDFSQLIDVGDAPSSLSPTVSLCPEEISVTAEPTEDGEKRKLCFSILLCGSAFSIVTEDKEVISDAFSSAEQWSCQVEPVCLQVPEEPVRGSVNKRISVRLPEGKTPMARINAVTFSVSSGSCDGKKSGCAEIGVIYTAAGTGELDGFTVSLPTEEDNRSDGEKMWSNVCLTDMQAVLISGKEAEIRFDTETNEFPQNTVCVNAVTGCSVEKREPPAYGLILCIVQPGETLWAIAKRYGVSPETLTAMNPGLTETPEPGKTIRVFRKLTVS